MEDRINISSELLAPPKINKQSRGREKLFAYLCTIPALALFAVIIILPFFNMLYTSFYEWNGVGGQMTFIGWENYAILFKSSKFLAALLNTLFIIVFVTVITLIIALYSASVLSKGKVRGKSFYRIVLYIPNILSIVVIAAIFSAIYDNGNGVLKAILGGSFNGWRDTRMSTLIYLGVAMIWQAFGYYMVMYIAGMDSIPSDLYEAADLEGASKMRQFMAITVPLTWQVIRVTLTFFLMSSINMSFLFVDAMMPVSAREHVLLTYMYEQAYTNSSYGYGMAIGTVIFAIVAILAFVVQRLTNRENVELA